MATVLRLESFILRQATFEARYSNAYIAWDRAGRIWSQVSSKWPKTKMSKAEPMVTNFLVDDRYDFELKLDMAHVTDLTPSSSLKEFTSNADEFINIVADSIDLREFTRLGFRLIYSRKFTDKYEAANSLISTKMISVPTGKHFNYEGKVVMPNFSMRWEGESAGVRAMLTAQDKKIDLDVAPGEEEIRAVHVERSEVVFDIDYYTLKTTTRGQLNAKEWISQAYHLIKRDSRAFLGA
jgi:hypothetical protein